MERVLREESGAGERVRARRLLRLRRRYEHRRGHRDVPLGRDVRRPDPRLLRRERRRHVRQGASARPLSVQVRGRSPGRAAATGARRGDDPRERPAPDAAADRDAQRDDGLAVAALQQSGCALQPARAGVPEPRHPALAARPREHRRAHVLPARGDRHRRRKVVRLRRRRRHDVQQPGLPALPDGDARALQPRLGDR